MSALRAVLTSDLVSLMRTLFDIAVMFAAVFLLYGSVQLILWLSGWGDVMVTFS